MVDGESESVEAAARRSGKCTGVKASKTVKRREAMAVRSPLGAGPRCVLLSHASPQPRARTHLFSVALLGDFYRAGLRP